MPRHQKVKLNVQILTEVASCNTCLSSEISSATFPSPGGNRGTSPGVKKELILYLTFRAIWIDFEKLGF